MFYFVPLDSYLTYYHVITFVFASVCAIHIFCHSEFYQNSTKHVVLDGITLLFVAILILYVGLRPVSFAFGDMGNYNRLYQFYASGGAFDLDGDLAFYLPLYFFSQYVSAEFFFFVCYLFYITLIVIACMRIFRHNWIWALVSVVVLFSFWQYGTNGIRNGLSTSFFLLGLTLSGPLRIITFFISFGLHSSAIILIISLYVSIYHRKTTNFFLGWIVCLIITILVPSIGDVISSIGFLDEKVKHYATLDDINVGTKEFRLDFLIFSALPILFGWVYLRKVGELSLEYHNLLSIYLTCNAFWLLVIRYPASNRFAYLSWFLYGFVLVYPFLSSQIVRYQNRLFAMILIFLWLLSVFIVKG